MAYIAGRFHTPPAAKAFTISYNPLASTWNNAAEFQSARDNVPTTANAFPITAPHQPASNGFFILNEQKKIAPVLAKAGFVDNQPEDIGEECVRLKKQIEHYQRKKEEQREKWHNMRMENMLTVNEMDLIEIANNR